MKKINLLGLLVVLSLAFTACSEDSVIAEQQKESLVKKVEVKKDYNGDYYLDFTTKADAKVDRTFDQTTNSNQFFVSSSSVKSNRVFSEGLILKDSELKIGFVDMSSSNGGKSITLIDDNIALAKGNDRGLTSYNITSQEDGLITLDFTVSNGISVDFSYNEEIDTYEIHLNNGKTSNTSFSRNFEKEDGKVLRIDFVNHYKNQSSKSETLEAERKPRVVIDTMSE